MKNKLLAAMALCCATSMSAWAGSWNEPQYQFADPDLTIPSEEVPTTGYKYLRGLGDYYIYHVNTGKFLTDGNDAGTQLSLGTTGQIVRLGYGYDRFLYNSESYNYLGWILTMPNASSNAASDGVKYHEIYLHSSGAAAYVDGYAGHMLWKIMKQDNGNYRIAVIDDDELFGTTSGYSGVWGRSITEENPDPTAIYPLADASNSTSDMTIEEGEFKFITTAAWDAYQARVAMYELLNEAEKSGVTEAELSEALSVYNNADATAAEILAATENMKDLVTEALVKNATVDNPADLTYLVHNADCSSLDGWTTSGTVAMQTNGETWTDGSDLYIEPCNWGATGWTSEFYQTVSVPNGMYKLTVSGRASEEVTLQVYANESVANFNSIGASGGNIDVTGKEWPSIEEGIANGATFANNNAGRGWEYRSVTATVSNGQLKIGAKATTTAVYQWASVFKFTLLCLGPVNTEYMRGELTSLISEVEANVNNYVNMNYYFSTAGKASIDADIAEAKELVANASATEEELILMHTKLTTSMEAFDYDVKVYEQLPAKLQELEDMINDRGAGELSMDAFWNYYDEIDDSYSDKTFDPAEFEKITANAEAYFVEGIREAIISGETTDATPLINNPKFANGATGWSGTTFQASNNGVCVEQYNKEFDNYQELTGLPAGTYEITVQAFYRPGGYAACASTYKQSGDTSNDIRVYLYGNSAQTPVKHLFEDCYAENPGDGFVAISAPNAPEVDGMYVPNTYAAAATVFNDGKYADVSVRCAVGEDGVLRFGMKTVGRNSTVNSTDWSAFTNFTITYLGEDNLDGYKVALESDLANAETLYNSASVKANQDAAALNALRISIVMAMGDYTTAQQYTDASSQLKEAIELVQNGVDLIAEIYAQALVYQEAYETGQYEGYDASVVYHLIYDVCDEITYSYDEQEFDTYADVESIAKDLQETYSSMIFGNGEASVDNPIDVTTLIKNPSFSDYTGTGSTEGWDLDGKGEYIGPGTADKAGDNLVEVYNKSGFDVNQTIYALKSGWYILKMQGFYRSGSFTNAATTRKNGTEAINAYLYVTPSDQQGGAIPLCSIFDGLIEGFIGDPNTEGRHSSDLQLDESLFLDGDKDPCFAPNTAQGSTLRFAQGYYWNEIAFEVTDATESVRFGLKQAAEDALSTDWTIFDNFQLFYTGAEKPNVATAIENVEVSTADVVSSVYYTIGGIRIEKPAQSGLYIREDLLSDGTKKVTKVMVK